jgi:hypothetical protein
LKTLRQFFLIAFFIFAVMPLVIVAQDEGFEPIVVVPADPCPGCIEYPAGPLLVPLTSDEIPMPPPPPLTSDEIPVPPLPPLTSDDIPVPPPPPLTSDEIPWPGGEPEPIRPDEIPNPPQNGTVVPVPTVQPPPLPIGLVRGYYRQVGTPTETVEGQCFDPSAGAGGLCAADPSGTNETQDFNNCWGDDPDNGPNETGEHWIPACQSADTESFYLFDQSQFYGRLAGSAYGRGSMNRTLLEQGGVSIGIYSALQGTQIEVLSPTKFLVKYVHREQAGCTRIATFTYELAEQNESACQQIIEIPPEEQPEIISTPEPPPPVEETKQYTVVMPVIAESCTETTQPPADFTQAQLTLETEASVLTVNYGTGSFTAYRSFGNQFSYIDQRDGVFRLDFTIYDGRVGFYWHKTGVGGATCTVEGELRIPGQEAATAPDSPMAVISDQPYNVTWTPVPGICEDDFLAQITFNQAHLIAEDNGFEIDYGTGSYTLATQDGGGDIYMYMNMGEDGSSTMVSLISHTAQQFSMLYQYSDTTGQTCVTNFDLTASN